MKNESLILEMLTLLGTKSDAFKIETVGAVIRRQFTRTDGEDANCIDLYPQWNKFGTYGTMRIAVEYMDNDWQIARFEKFSGLVYADLPIMESETAPRRRFGQEHKYEFQVINPFRLMIIPQKDDDGNNQKGIIHSYLPPTTQTVVRGEHTAVSQPTPTPTRQVQPAPEPETAAVEETTGDDDYWRNEAIMSDDPLLFDSAISKYVPGLSTPASVESTRAQLFGEWDRRLSGLYTTTLERIMSTYHDLLTNGTLPNKAAWVKAKEANLREHNLAVEKFLADLAVQGKLPLQSSGNNYER